MPDPLWTITGITDVTTFEQGIGAVQSKRIDFKVMGGVQSFITVPLSKFSKDSVASMIHDAAINIIEVQSLQGPDVSAPVEFQG